MNGSLLPRMLLACTFLIAAPVVADELCFVPSQVNGFNITVDCFQNPYAHDWTGYRISGGEPCSTEIFDGIPCGDWSQYYWTISNSDTNPLQNTGALASGAPLYLWFVCDSGWEISAAEFRLEGTLPIVSFEPLNGFINVYEFPDFGLLAPECFGDVPIVAGEITVGTPVSIDHAVDTGWGRIKELYR